jgi:hypothetical protein
MQATTESVDMLICTLRNLQMIGTIVHSEVGFGGAGGDIIATMRHMGATITGINGQICDLEGHLPKLLAEMIAVPEEIIENYIEASLTEFNVSMSEDNIELITSIQPLTAKLTAQYTTVIPAISGTLTASLQPFEANLESNFDYVSATFKPLTGIFTGYPINTNDLEAELENLMANMFSFSVIPPDGETCEPYETLKYEEVV